MSQPAVTKHVRELESLYGVRLFDRKGNSISLTEAGKLLMEHCERILDDYRKLEYDMHQLNNEYAGELRLGQVRQSHSMCFRLCWLLSRSVIPR